MLAPLVQAKMAISWSFLHLHEVDREHYPTAQELRVGQNSFFQLGQQAGRLLLFYHKSKSGLELIDH